MPFPFLRQSFVRRDTLTARQKKNGKKMNTDPQARDSSLPRPCQVPKASRCFKLYLSNFLLGGEEVEMVQTCTLICQKWGWVWRRKRHGGFIPSWRKQVPRLSTEIVKGGMGSKWIKSLVLKIGGPLKAVCFRRLFFSLEASKS